MKKTLVPLCMGILCLSACSRETETVVPLRKKSSCSALSAGQIHNRVLSKYLDRQGLVSDSEISIDEAYTEMLALAEISKANEFLPGRSADELADASLTYQIESGYFENGNLKPTEAIHALVLEKIENPAIRSAIRQIDALAGEDGTNFVDDSRQILARLELVSARDRDLVE